MSNQRSKAGRVGILEDSPRQYAPIEVVLGDDIDRTPTLARGAETAAEYRARKARESYRANNGKAAPLGPLAGWPWELHPFWKRPEPEVVRRSAASSAQNDEERINWDLLLRTLKRAATEKAETKDEREPFVAKTAAPVSTAAPAAIPPVESKKAPDPFLDPELVRLVPDPFARRVLIAVCQDFKILPIEVVGEVVPPRRAMTARNVVFYLLYYGREYSLKVVAAIFRLSSTTSVVYPLKDLRDRMEERPETRERLEALAGRLGLTLRHPSGAEINEEDTPRPTPLPPTIHEFVHPEPARAAPAPLPQPKSAPLDPAWLNLCFEFSTAFEYVASVAQMELEDWEVLGLDKDECGRRAAVIKTLKRLAIRGELLVEVEDPESSEMYWDTGFSNLRAALRRLATHLGTKRKLPPWQQRLALVIQMQEAMKKTAA